MIIRKAAKDELNKIGEIAKKYDITHTQLALNVNPKTFQLCKKQERLLLR